MQNISQTLGNINVKQKACALNYLCLLVKTKNLRRVVGQWGSGVVVVGMWGRGRGEEG